jgi:uncharacterized protein (TIGR02678 family)
MIADAAATERRQAACALLSRPILTSRTDPAALTLARRHATALSSTFATVLGYQLVVESGFARLVKAPLAPPAPTRPARRRSSGRPFTTTTYSYVALVAAALLAPGTGEQVLISDLVAQVRADAATAGISLPDSAAESRDLVAALHWLEDWGVLTETDGTVNAWSDRGDEALLTVHRSLLPHLLARPLADLDSAAAAWTDDDADAQPRRSLRRKLVENPVLSRDDLSPAERDVLSRERTELSRVLEEAFGLVLEVRAEGLLTYQPDDGLTDVDFPGPGTVKQAALLLVNVLTDLGRPTATTTAVVDGRETAGLHSDWARVDDALTDLISRYRRSWGGIADDVAALRTAIVTLLTEVSLGTATPTGLVLHPAAGRYQPETAPQQPTRARRRLAAGALMELPGIVVDNGSGEGADPA